MAEIQLFVRALMLRDHLTPEEHALLANLPRRTHHFEAGEEIIRQDERTTESCLLVSGFALRCQYLSDGQRQIMAVHVAGDFVDLHAFLLKVMDHSVEALGPCAIAFVPHEALRYLTEKSSHLARLLWLSTVIDGAIQRVWITGLGRRSPIQRLAHLVCELYLRLEAVQLAADFKFDMPINQSHLGDMLGLSTVHTNRTLQSLRATGLVTWRGNSIRIVDFEKCQEFADFDPAYLNLWREPR